MLNICKGGLGSQIQTDNLERRQTLPPVNLDFQRKLNK